MKTEQHHQRNTHVVHRLRQDVKSLSNIDVIFEKMGRDGHITNLQSTLEGILWFEIDFTISQLLKPSIQTHPNELKGQLAKNTYIFKENLKSIVGLLGSLIS